MSGIRTWLRRGRGLAVAASAVAALAGTLAAGPASASSGASASPSGTPSGAASAAVLAAQRAGVTAAAPPACAGVLFVGARGSGELGPGDKHWKPSRADPYGLGPTVNSVYDRMAAGLRGFRAVHVISVSYAAYSVETLFHARNQYFNGLAAGVNWTLGRLASQARSCPDQQIVLAGFSQGAMVMHRVLHDLGTTAARRRILARVAAAVLVGDGDQIPDDNQVRFGTAARNARGIAQSLRKISHASPVKFTPAVGARVLSVCDAHDLVCGWSDFNLLCLSVPLTCVIAAAIMVKIHLGYPRSKPLLAAADQASRDVLAGRWLGGRLIDANGGLTAVSCPAASFCLAVDSSGNAYTYDRGRWSGPVDAGDGTGLSGVSCASPGFCVAITSGATAYVDRGGTWTGSQLAGADGNPANLTAVSCPAAGYCVATGDDDSYTYSRGAWAKGVVVQVSNTLISISCPSASFCLAADGSGNVYADSRGRWSGPRQIAGGAYLTSVSCHPASFCVATSSGNTAYTSEGGRWSARQLVGADGNPANLTAVSCPAAGFCAATGDWDGYVYSVGAWTRGHLLQDVSTFTSVSCSSASFCAAVDDGGRAFTYTAS